MILKNVLFVILAVTAGHFLAIPFGSFLSQFIDIGGSFAGNTLEYYMFGYPLAYSAMVALLFAALGDKNKLWFLGFALIPAVIFEVALAPVLIFYSTAVVLVISTFGVVLNKTLWKLTPRFMSRITA